MTRPSFRVAPVRVRVPATSANLGPGFDSLGLALSMYDDIAVRVADSGLSVDMAGEGAEVLPRTEEHLVVRALRTAFDALGGQPPGLEVVCANRIPHDRGLGSSAAAIVAGMAAARALVPGGSERLDDDALLALAARMEGHPDNVAPCLLGGVTVAWTETASGGARAVSLEPAEELRPVAFVPTVRTSAGSTAVARGLLPEVVPHSDAVHNVGRAALLVYALTSDPALLLSATEDRLHQAYRAAAMPQSAHLVETLRGDGIAAVVSGAGPTVLALMGNTPGQAADLSRYTMEGWSGVHLAVDSRGTQVLSLAG